jgi:hypothetical protein
MKTAKEMELAILEALQQTNHPMKGLIELVLERWELQIRKDQAEIDHKENMKLINNPYNQS